MAHEDLTRQDVVEGSSNRSFGFVFAVVFLVITVWPMLSGGAPRVWALVVSALFLLVALVRPAWLAVLNRWWMQLGLLLGKIVSPVALGLLFFLVFAPLGAVMRWTGQDPLRLKLEPRADSYWIPRDPPGPPPQSMTNQF